MATLITDNAGFNDSGTNYIKLYFNNSLYNLFESFPSFTSNSYSTSGLFYQISCSSYGIAETTTINSYTALLCSQEFSTISIWNPVTSIIFISNTLPIKAENLGAPLLYLNDETYQSTNSNKIASVITDFQPGDNIYKSYVNYQPSLLRYIQLNGNQPISKIGLVHLYHSN